MKQETINTTHELDNESSLSFPFKGMQLIEASAGTGKTYTIANLFLRLICEGRKLSEILVVTFTNAATNELRSRIRTRLHDALHTVIYLAANDANVVAILNDNKSYSDAELSAFNPNLIKAINNLSEDTFLRGLMRLTNVEDYGRTRDLLSLAIQSMDEASIFTIHGYCQRTLAEFAFLSNVSFDATLGEDSHLIHQAAEDWWRITLYPDYSHAAFLSETLGDFDVFYRYIKPLLSIQDKQLNPVATSQSSLEENRLQIEKLQQQFSIDWKENDYLAELAELFSSVTDNDNRIKNKDETKLKLLQALDRIDAHVKSGSEIFLNTELEVLDKHKPLESRAFFTKNIPWGEEPFTSATEIKEQISNYTSELKRYHVAQAVSYIQVQVAKQKFDLNLLSYDDLLAKLADALNSNKGAELAASLRQRYPIAMIDEFQDTDPIQYRIFQTIYLNQADFALIMIGDPKQAIYSFRGADIFTYIKARSDVGENNIWTLTTNWRSTPEVVESVNRVFQREQAFVFDDIPFAKAVAASKPHQHLIINGNQQAAMTVWELPLNAKNKSLSTTEVRAKSHKATASEIAKLIHLGEIGDARIGERAVCPGDIAVLTRSHFESADLAIELKKRGVSAVAKNRDNIWLTDEAESLLQLLTAVIDPTNRKLTRRALCAPIFEFSAEEIYQSIFDENRWEQWISALLHTREIWLSRGFMAAFQHLISHTALNARLNRTTLPERRLTNLIHLAELVQNASKSHPGPDAILAWYREQQNTAERDASELRLENDENLVQIVTIHSSKGLQYPIVFVPYLSLCNPRDKFKDNRPMIEWHNQGKHFVTGDWTNGGNFLLSERERLAEDIRLTYVALTRAESALWLVWGAAGSQTGHSGQSALAWLLHQTQSQQDLISERPEAYPGSAFPGFDGIRQKLIQNKNGDEKKLIQITDLPETDHTSRSTAVLETVKTEPLIANTFKGSIATDWRISSFTAMTRDIHQAFTPPSKINPDKSFALQFTAGAHVGSFLHLAYEKLDFSDSDFLINAQLWCNNNAARFGIRLEEDSAGHIAYWLLETLSQPLAESGPVLKDLKPEQLIKEMAFDFSTNTVDINALNTIMKNSAGGHKPHALTISNFKGMVSGMIDLVFEFEGKYYIADYKSNLLGRRYEDYNEDKIKQAIYDRRYDLQYLLYTLALHRHLSISLPDYDYEQHFGGAYYLFIRAMSNTQKPGFGVYYDRPTLSLVNELNDQIFKRESAA